ncbi:hypothetical protein Vdis_1130 [Vulcanisaeta distributa DSM 14429]|uniref:Uncharacterized protein n=2 Tax=Vulcanisaeta distributa TaxID=164451 RepID=E1QQU8_VULDI|nr:hypothetical protein Vdis_1130 [Vulcanisaeta distributa DSM 14429]
MKGYVVITAIRMVKRSIPLLIVALALMVVPKAVFALGGCYIFAYINLTSTGFPYSVVFYVKVSPSYLVHWPPVTAGLFNKTVPITLSEGAPQVSILFLNKTINYVSPKPPFFYTAELTVTWSYAVYPTNITNYVAYAQLGPWLNMTMISNSCRYLSTYVVLRPVPTIINARPNWAYFGTFIVMLALLVGALLIITYLLLIKPIRKPASNSLVSFGIYRFGRGMLIFLVTSIINIIMTIAFLMSSISMGSPPPALALSSGLTVLNHVTTNLLYVTPQGRLTMGNLAGIATYMTITSAIIDVVDALLIIAMVFLKDGFSKLGLINDNVRIGYYGSLISIFGIVFLMAAYPMIIITAEPLAIYAIEHVTPPITQSTISIIEGIITAAILGLIGAIISLSGFIMTLAATYRLLSTYSPTIKYIGLAIIMLIIGFVLNFVSIMGISLGLIIYAPTIAYLYYLTTLVLGRVANLNDVGALILSAEHELDMARTSTYPIDNLRRAFNYVVKALAIREGLPEVQDVVRTGHWTNQLITSAVMRLLNKLPTVKELWLSLNQESLTNIDETIGKVRELLRAF